MLAFQYNTRSTAEVAAAGPASVVIVDVAVTVVAVVGVVVVFDATISSYIRPLQSSADCANRAEIDSRSCCCYLSSL